MHGGLHPVLRLLAPLERVAGPRVAAHRPLVLDLPLHRALPLEKRVEFEGEYEEGPDGPRLFTRFDPSGRLDGRAYAIGRDEACVDLAPWRDALEADLGTPPIHHFEVRGVPIRVGERLLAIEIDDALWSLPEHDLIRVRQPDGTCDATFASVALDIVGASTGGFEWQSRLFTSHLRLVLLGDAPASCGPLVALGDRRRMFPREDSTLPSHEVDGVLRPETEVPVLFADRALRRVYAFGVVSVYPVR